MTTIDEQIAQAKRNIKSDLFYESECLDANKDILASLELLKQVTAERDACAQLNDDQSKRVFAAEAELAETKRLLVEAREEGRLAGLREAKEIINNLTKNRTKEDFYPDAYDCRDAITRAAEGK